MHQIFTKELLRRVFIFGAMLTAFIPNKLFSQACAGNEISVTIQNFTQSSSNSVEFDILVKNTGTNSYCLKALAGGFTYNPSALNGGSLSASYTLLGSYNILPAFGNLGVLTTPTHQVRWQQGPSAVSPCVNVSGPGASAVWEPVIHMVLTNTLNFSTCDSLNLVLNYGLGNQYSNTIATVVCNGNPSTTALSSSAAGTMVVVNPATYNLNCSIGCPTSINMQVTDACLGGTVGSAVANLSGLTAAPNGTYTLNGGSAINYTTNPINLTNLSVGNYTLSVINQDSSGNSCTPVTTTFTVGTSTSPLSNSLTASACNSYTWAVTGSSYTSSGTYTGTSTNANGCQVAETLNLTITPNSTVTIIDTHCISYTWPLTQQTYSASGVYTHTDSCTTTNLNLTIVQLTGTMVTQTATGSYTWPVNNMTYSISGTYTAPNGFCRVDTLKLTILPNAIGDKQIIESTLLISPVPTHDYVQLEFEVLKPTNLQIEICDISGRKIFVENVKAIIGKNHGVMDLSGYAKGIYLMRISDSSELNLVKKIIKE
jgi:hypothetical protein